MAAAAARSTNVCAGYAVADADNCVTFAEASALLLYLHDQAGQPWPSPFAVALSLDAANVISVALLNAWAEPKQSMVEGAAWWAGLLDSYTETCFPSPEGTSVRILIRGTLPDGWRVPPAVKVQDRDFVTLTCQRISPRPSWLSDNGGTIRNATEALEELLVPKKRHYISL